MVLKKKLACRPLLAVYDSQADIEVHTDASKVDVSGILSQKASVKQLRLVEYYSRAATAQEQVYIGMSSKRWRWLSLLNVFVYI